MPAASRPSRSALLSARVSRADGEAEVFIEGEYVRHLGHACPALGDKLRAAARADAENVSFR